MKRRLPLAPILLVCGLLLTFLALAWQRLADMEMSWQGWLAFGLGCALSLALAGVLMGLLFHSSRSGADEEASDQSVFRRRGYRRRPSGPDDEKGDETGGPRSGPDSGPER